ncbi:hypothetical protein [Mangrovibacterium sp.]|uniref:hypothetical protein n=1 Tax=Mangrovibacterium sp. TaxID=1961364 RepID=UPI00356140BF
MNAKKDVAPMTVQKGETTPKNEVKTTKVSEAKQPTPEELQKQVAELQKKLASIPQNLEQRIEYFNQKKELIRRLSVLNVNHETLSEHLDKLSELAAVNEFENEDYFLSIDAPNGYGKKAVYTLKNPVIIGEMITFILGRIDAKRKELKTAIEA